MMKKFIALTLILSVVAGVILIAVPGAESKVSPYYQGDAVNYDGDLIVGSTNAGMAEIFRLENGQLVKKLELASRKELLPGGDTMFYDLALSQYMGNLYLYLVDGKYFYQYDISDLTQPKLMKMVKDPKWGWFVGVKEASDGRIATIGTNGIKVWSQANLQIIDSYEITNLNRQDNIVFTADGNFILNIVNENSEVEVYDIYKREVVSKTSLNIAKADTFHKIYVDENNYVYIAEDSGVRVFSLNNATGELVSAGHYDNDVDFGYDAAGVPFEKYVYYTNGLAVLKLDRHTMKHVMSTSFDNSSRSDTLPYWAIGLNVVDSLDGEFVVVFYNSAIMVFDQDFNFIDRYEAANEKSFVVEPLSLKTDKTLVKPGDAIIVSGTGFGSGEDIKLLIEGKVVGGRTDSQGKFAISAIMPETNKQIIDIKANGTESGFTYSTTIRITR